jgi:hypothetical protein
MVETLPLSTNCHRFSKLRLDFKYLDYLVGYADLNFLKQRTQYKGMLSQECRSDLSISMARI